MTDKTCPDTGDACTCDDDEPCTCGCGHCGHTPQEEAAAAAYREAHRAEAAARPAGEEPERKIIVSFDSTFDVMECERLCLEAGVPGRIVPLPGSITAGCGLAWSMPFSGDALAAFRSACEGRVQPADYHQLVI